MTAAAAPIDVCLTVDVEFSLNSALMRPGRRPLTQAWVQGVANGRSEGLGFLLDCLDRYGLRGTFFTEVFNTYHCGDGPMAGIVEQMLARGHDVQLHLHPVWLYYRFEHWRTGLSADNRPRDSFTGRPPEEIAGWLEDGAAILARLSGSRPIAFRSGNLNAGPELYAGMRAAGIGLASNIGVGLSPPAEPALHLYAGLHRIDGVTEVPVTSYRTRLTGGRTFLLTATGSAFAEMRAVLDGAARRGIGPIVVLLHPHDFRIALTGLTGADVNAPDYRADPVRQSRLTRLCRYLADHPERFRVSTFAETAARWQAAAETANPLLHGSVAGLAVRLLQNQVLPRLRGLPQ